MQPWVAEKRKEIYDNQEKAEYLDPRVRCLQSGVPRAQHAGLLQLVPDHPEAGLRGDRLRVEPHDAHHPARRPPASRPADPPADGRLARTVGGQHPGGGRDQLQRRHLGPRPRRRSARGSRSQTATSGHGIVHSPELHVVERFTPVDKDIIHYEARIEDPKVFTRPFTISSTRWSAGAPITSSSSMRVTRETGMAS